MIKDQAIALRLKAGSDEAGYLAQIFPLPRTPTVVIIKNGDLKEYITPETTKEDFMRRIQTSFSAPTSSAQPAPAVAPQPEPTPAVTLSQPASASPSTSESVRRILAERAKVKAEKEEADRKAQKERKAQEERAKAKGKEKAEDAVDASNDRAHKAAEEVRKRRQHDQEERRRILARIEADKAERKLQAALREQHRREESKADGVASSPSTLDKPVAATGVRRSSGMTAVQVRLFDGSTLRSRFKSEVPLKHVRTWVDENRNDGTQPYTFKQVLTPMPNKTIDATEEDKSVGELGLSPSSTLVLIPVQKYSSAYDASSPGIVSKMIAFFLGIFYWFLGLFTSGETQGTTDAPANSSENRASSQDRSRIQQFQNQNDRLRDQQLYNGNSVS